MTHKHSGSATNSAPSLFGEITAAAATDKTISILSAVTGRETATDTSRHKGEASAARRYLPLSLLLLAALGGLVFWQQGESGYATQRAPLGNSLLVGEGTKQPAASKPGLEPGLAAAKAGLAAPGSIGKMDVAVIETVTDRSAPVSIEQTATESMAAAGTVNVDVQPPRLARANTVPTEEKTDTKKKTAAQSAGKTQTRAVSKTVRQNVTASSSKATRTAARPEKTADADEKLLEAMLRLVNRDGASNADKKSAAK